MHVDQNIGTEKALQSQRDIALEHYKALRVEVIERLKMREQMLLAYLAAVAGLFGFAFSQPNQPELYDAILILMPVLL